MNMTVAILAGGLATRLRPLTSNTAKSMIPVLGKPFIEWQLRLLSESGIREIVLCLGHLSHQIVQFVGTGREFGVNVKYSLESRGLGTAGALVNARDILGNVYGVLYGDSYLPIAYETIFHEYLKGEKRTLMTISRNIPNHHQKNVYYEKDLDFYYSKFRSEDRMNYIDYGFTVLSSNVLARFQQGEYVDLADVLELESRTNHVHPYVIEERFYEIGSYEGISELESYLYKKERYQ